MKNKNNKSVIIKIKDILKKDLFQNDLINLEKSFNKKNIFNPYLLKENIKSSIPNSGKKTNKSSEKNNSKFGIIKITNEYNKYSKFNLINYKKIKKENDEFLKLYKSNKNFYSKKNDFLNNEKKTIKKSKSENLFKTNPLLILNKKSLDLYYYFKQKEINFNEEKSVNYLKRIQCCLNNNFTKKNKSLNEKSLNDSINKSFKNDSKKTKLNYSKELNKSFFINKNEENQYKKYFQKIKDLINNVDVNNKCLENISSLKKNKIRNSSVLNNSVFNNSFSVSENIKNKIVPKSIIKKKDSNFHVKKLENFLKKNKSVNFSNLNIKIKLNRSLSNDANKNLIQNNLNFISIDRKKSKNRTLFLKKSKIDNISKEKKLNDLFVNIKKSPLTINKNILKEIKKFFKNKNNYSFDSSNYKINLFNFLNIIKNKFKKNDINDIIKNIELKFSPKINKNIKKIKILNNEMNKIDLNLY